MIDEHELKRPIDDTKGVLFLLFIILFIVGMMFSRCHAQAPVNCIKVERTHYWYYYDTALKAPAYSFYMQTTAHARMGSLDRSPTKVNPHAGFPIFHEDTIIPKKFRIATKAKYAAWNKAHTKAQRRDIGHLAPFTAIAYDSAGAVEIMNIDQCAPQPSAFNEHPWEQVEMYVLKKMAPVQDSISVWTGLVYDTANVVPVPANMKYMGDIPEAYYYWKVTKYIKDSAIHYKVWLGLNDPSTTDTDITKMEVPVDRVRKMTGLEF